MSKSFVWGAVSILIAFLLGALACYFPVKGHFEAILEGLEPEVVEVIVRDTLRVSEPVYVASKPIHDSIPIPIHDTTYIVRADTLYLPKEQKEYADSTYRAWVSGVSPRLDSIYVFPVTKIITKSVPKYTERTFNVGLQAGVGAVSPISKFSPTLGYYVGVGVQYNF